jgi:hypothetical protein
VHARGCARRYGKRKADAHAAQTHRAVEDIAAGAASLLSPEAARQQTRRAYAKLYEWGTLEEIAQDLVQRCADKLNKPQTSNPYAGRVHLHFFPHTVILMLDEGVRETHQVRLLGAATRASCLARGRFLASCVLCRVERAPHLRRTAMRCAASPCAAVALPCDARCSGKRTQTPSQG